MYRMIESLYTELSYLNGSIFFLYAWAVAISLLVHSDALEFSDDIKRNTLANFILRGVRTVADYEYERNLAYANRNLTGIETVLLYTLPELSYISSTMVKDLQSHGYDVSPYVPQEQ